MTKHYLLYLISKFKDTVEREKDFLGDYMSILEDMKKDLEKIGSALYRNPNVLGEGEISFRGKLCKVDESLMEYLTEAKRRKERREGLIDCMRFSLQRKWKKSLQQWNGEIKAICSQIKLSEDQGPPEKWEPEVAKIEPESEWSSSVFDVTKIYGWEDQVSEIYGDLKRSDEDLNTVGIVGMSGSGKTKLAQKVFADEEVMDLFSLRLWVWVSKGCSHEELLRRTLDNLGVEEEEINSAVKLAEENKLEKEGVLLFLLHLQLLDKRYLIVFDDVRQTDKWYCNLHVSAPDDEREWNRLAHGLPKGSGGAIIVTSRSEDDARRMVGRGAIHTPKRMSTEDAWKVFKEAYLEAGKKDSRQLEAMKQQITEKCAWFPLALKTAARELPPPLSPPPSPKKEAAEKKEEKGEEGMEKEKEEEATEEEEEEGGKGLEKEEKLADDEGEEGKESLALPSQPEVEKDKEGVKEMARGEKEEDRAGDEKEKESPPPPPPPLPPPPPSPLKEKDMGPAAPPPPQEEKDKEGMRKETTTGDENEKGKEPAAAALEEKKDKEATEKKEMSTGDEKEKGKEPAPPPSAQEKKDKEGMQKEPPLPETGERKPVCDEKEQGKESVADQKQGSA